jgi:tetratricopeptide (TPR) repeat protein
LRLVHILTIVAALILLVVLNIAIFYWGATIPPAKKTVGNMPAAGSPPGSNTVKPASFDSILTAAKAQLPVVVADSVATIEKQLAAIRDSSRMAAVFRQLAGVYGRSMQYNVFAFYTARAAKLENSEKSLTFAGRLFLQLMSDTVSQSVQQWQAEQAIGSLQQALSLDSSDEDARIGLATAYIEGQGQVMNGVQQLLYITRKNPEDVPANIMLAKLDMQRGDNAKAIGRFEGVLKQEPKNTEALYFMAEAYKNSGDKKKAIALFEQCKKIVDRPDFSRDIDGYIKSFK